MADEQNTQNKSNDTTQATGTTGISGSDNAASNQNKVSSSNNEPTASNQNDKSSSGTVDQIASTVANVLRGDTGAATGTAKGLVSQVKESGGKVASEALGQVKEKAAAKVEEQKATLAHGIGNVAETIRQVGDNLREASGENNVTATAAKYGDSLAKQVDQFSDYLEKHNISDLLREVEGFARRNPAYFIGGAFLLGLLGARFLKSSSPKASKYQSDGDEEVFHHHTERGVEGSGEGIRFE